MGDTILDALRIDRKDKNVYTAHIGPEHRFREFLHGGFAASLIVYTALEHAKTTLGRTKKQIVISFDLQYLKPVNTKEIELRVEEARVTKIAATLRVDLCQKGSSSVAGYVNVINSDANRGVTTKIDYALDPAPLPVDLGKLSNSTEDKWIIYHVPYSEKLGSLPLAHWNLGMMRSGPVNLRVHDIWYNLHDQKSRITTIKLPVLADLYLRSAENYIADSGFSYAACVDRATRSVNGDVPLKELAKALPRTTYWTATQSFNLEIVRQLPEEGVEWLLMRSEAKAIQDGRLIVELTIMDEQMNLIACGKGVDFLIPTQRWNDKGSEKGAKPAKI